MATIIPTISSCNDKITAGEKRLARILERGLGEECCCWYDIPTGDKHLHPDFMILSPEKGIIFLEVKDWFITKIKKANKSNVLYETQNGIQSLKNPIEQVRRYAFEAVNQLKKDPLLCQQDDRYNGNLLFPYGYGVYFSNITREALNNKIATVGYVTVQEAFGQTKGIKLMAIITSIVLIAPIIGPLSGAALMHFMHWKVLFAIIAVMGFISFVGLLLAMPETVKRGAVPFSAKSVLRDFRNVFCNRLFLFGAATISLSYIPMMSWVAVSPVILIDAGGLTTSQFAWTQVPVFGAVIVANAIVARFVKDPTEPRFIWRAVPIQLVGLSLLIIGNLLSPHVWLWSVLGTSLYAFGIGLIFPTLFRFTLFSNNLPKGTVSASLNMVILMVMSVSVEIGRWLWFNGGRLPFHLLAVLAGVIVVFTLAGLLNRVRQHQAAELAEER